MTTRTPYRYLVRTDGVRNGNTIVEGTRIGVHDVIGLLHNGETIESVAEALVGLGKAQVFECLAYYEDHKSEIDLLVARQMTDAE